MKKIIASLIFTIGANSSVLAVEVQQIELFVNSDMVVVHKAYARDVDLKVHYVDEVKHLEAEINRQLPKNPQLAKNMAKHLYSNQKLTRAFAKAYHAPIQAKLYGVKRLPAAVFNNGQGIVYGSTDIAKLLSVAESK